MHVLMTVNSAWNILNFRKGVLFHLIKQGHSITILAPADESVPQLLAFGCDFIDLQMDAKGLNPLNSLYLMWRMKKAFAKIKPDVILSYTIKNNVFGAMAARSSNIPFIPNVSGLGTAFLSGGFVEKVAEWLYRHAFKKLQTVFFQNGDDRDLFISRGLIDPKQAKLLPGSGIDLKLFEETPMPDKSEHVTFLMIARILRDKGVIEYIEAARILRARGYKARFRLLGALGSQNRTAIKPESVKAWVEEGIIEYICHVSDVRPQIEAADCVVLPSYREGAPRTLIEAAAMARPLIATDVPGCRDIVKDNRTGFLCVPRDASSLVSAFEDFLALSPTERETMGKAGRRRMEQYYDQAYVVSAYENAIRTAIKSRHQDEFG